MKQNRFPYSFWVKRLHFKSGIFLSRLDVHHFPVTPHDEGTARPAFFFDKTLVI